MTAGVAESNDGEVFSLTFMCEFGEPDGQDIRPGFDSYSLVTPDQGTAYGCIGQVGLDGDVLRVTLDALGLDDPVVGAVLRAPASDVAACKRAH
ncbi:hypothetical protein ACIP98_32710 [Streptomyces sp. NPDC088354]|uniref:hypothetical protein n=1 Tax=Streptomyces sp. NPDC088354 TaxID=3365856 RepID=UPI0038214994